MTHRLPSLVVFDLAGTTMQDDGIVAAVFRDVLATERARTSPEEIARVRGASKKEAFRRLARDEAQAGTAAGAGKVAGVACGAHDRARLSQSPHTHLRASVGDIPKLFL